MPRLRLAGSVASMWAAKAVNDSWCGAPSAGSRKYTWVPSEVPSPCMPVTTGDNASRITSGRPTRPASKVVLARDRYQAVRGFILQPLMKLINASVDLSLQFRH